MPFGLNRDVLSECGSAEVAETWNSLSGFGCRIQAAKAVLPSANRPERLFFRRADAVFHRRVRIVVFVRPELQETRSRTHEDTKKWVFSSCFLASDSASVLFLCRNELESYVVSGFSRTVNASLDLDGVKGNNKETAR